MIREQRSTRGQRMTALVGKAMEEDDLFYSNDIWKEDGDDDSGNESYGEEFEEEQDIFDDDFNDTEDDSDSDDDEDEKNTRKTEMSQKRKISKIDNRYKEPGIVPIKKKRDIDAPRPPKIQDNVENEAFLMRTRVSTQAKTMDADEARKIACESASCKKTPTKEKAPRRVFTQKQLLSEALSTEGDNLRWIEVQKKAAQAKDILNNRSSKQKLTRFIRFYSRKGRYDTVTFSDFEAMPKILKQKQ